MKQILVERLYYYSFPTTFLKIHTEIIKFQKSLYLLNDNFLG